MTATKQSSLPSPHELQLNLQYTLVNTHNCHYSHLSSWNYQDSRGYNPQVEIEPSASTQRTIETCATMSFTGADYLLFIAIIIINFTTLLVATNYLLTFSERSARNYNYSLMTHSQKFVLNGRVSYNGLTN